MAVSDYSTTPASNTTISAIDIAEGCSPAGLNNAFRQLMADVRVFYDSVPSAATYVTKTAGVFSGTQPTYTGRGAYAHHNNSAYTSCRIFVQASGGATPSGMLAGDILLEY
jgi:hypothetical protein